MNLLLLASGAPIQYRVLRCAAAAGANVHILGDDRAGALARSRHIKSFTRAVCDLGLESAERIIEQLNALVGPLDIDLVLPTEGQTTALLAAIRNRLATSCFPMPTAETFATLDNKASFMRVCAELGVPHPVSWLATKDELRDRHQRGALSLPCIVKPVSMYGRIGVYRLDQKNASEQIEQIDYEPILVQDFVPGQDLCTSLFCERGNVLAEVAYTRHYGTFYFTQNPILSENTRKIARHFAYDGVLAFDSRITPDGKRVEFIECNPRFWFNIDIAMLSGINFVELGLILHTGGRITAPNVSGQRVGNFRRSLANLTRPWRLNSVDIKSLRYYLSDPAMLVLLEAGLSRFVRLPRDSRQQV